MDRGAFVSESQNIVHWCKYCLFWNPFFVLINFHCFNFRIGYLFFQECDRNDKHKWTNNNNLQCSDNNVRTNDDRCVNGVCVGTPYSCLSCQTHDGSGCPIKPGYCILDHGGKRTCFAKNQYIHGNPCQVGIKPLGF